MNRRWLTRLPPLGQLDSEYAMGMPYAAVAPSALCRVKDARPPEDLAKHFQRLFYALKCYFTTTNSKLQIGTKHSYGLLPFRALEDHCLPAAIQQRWEASVAASRSAEWHLWFRNLNPEKQKAVVQTLSKRTKDKFWAGLLLEYEKCSKPRRTRHVAAAARVQVILEPESIKKLTRPSFTMSPHFQRILPAETPEPLSAPITCETVISLDVRLAPSYFRLPNHARRFAAQIFRGQPYEEAVTKQKANFNSWVKEAKTMRVKDMPDYVVYDNMAVHKDDVPECAWGFESCVSYCYTHLALPHTTPYDRPKREREYVSDRDQE